VTRTLLVTGASRGIGEAVARLAAARGDAVGVNYAQDEAGAQRVVADIEAAGGRALALRADVSDNRAVEQMFERAWSELGPLDVLVNNGGIVGTQSRLDAMTAERMQRVLAVNVLGTLLCAREAVRRMSTRHGGTGGCIVNVSSAASRLGSPGEYVDYAASKGAVDTFTLGLAREVADEGIRVAAVRPGIIDTSIHASGGDPGRIERLQGTIPMQRAGTADEVARAILWLASDEANYSTGAIVDVAGGR
jgi:NAD(P)-dependent dehydrogenase (short-subunit alcohol dehydrogenase family)